MKKIILIITLNTLLNFSYGQDVIKLSDLNIPTSPAFVIMDKSPASIEKPSNPKAFAASLINIWQNNGALEFTPYWFKDREAYKFERNLKKVAPIFQTFAVSGATSKKDSITNIAVGFRTQLIRYYGDSIYAKIISIKNHIVELLSVINPDSLNLNAINEERKKLITLQAKTTLNIELAGAYMGQSSSLQKLASVKEGVWLNIRWTPYESPIDFVFLTRYLRSTGVVTKTGKDSSCFDYGLNLSYQDQDKNFDIQVEYVNRRDIITKHNYNHFALVANYQIIPGIVAVASIGKDFKLINNVFTLLGLKFAISKEVAKL